MKSLIFIGGPLIATIALGLWTDAITYGDQNPGIVHFAGIQPGGTFGLIQKDTYVCDEGGSNCTLVDSTTSEFSDVEGLDFEEEVIEYREGAGNDYNKTKQPGLSKYTDIHLKMPSSFDYKAWRFEFERQAAHDAVDKEFDERLEEMRAEE